MSHLLFDVIVDTNIVNPSILHKCLLPIDRPLNTCIQCSSDTNILRVGVSEFICSLAKPVLASYYINYRLFLSILHRHACISNLRKKCIHPPLKCKSLVNNICGVATPRIHRNKKSCA